MITDKIGQEIKEGSYIVYGHALGRCAALKLGLVLKVGFAKKEGLYSKHRITVIGTDEMRLWELNNIDIPYLTKVGTLMFPDRIIILPREKIPGNILELFDQYQKDGANYKFPTREELVQRHRERLERNANR